MSYGRGSRSTGKVGLKQEVALYADAARKRGGNADALYWTPEAVSIRLHEAMRSIAAAVSAPRPKEFGNSMPDYLRALENEFEFDEQEPLPVPAAPEMSRALEAIEWPGRYLVGKQPGANGVLRVWLRAVARRRSIKKAMSEAGYSKSMCESGLAKAFSEIAEGLARDGIPLR